MEGELIGVTPEAVNNVFRFVTALVLLPGIFTIGRRIRMPWARTPFLVGILALVLSFGMSCVDQQLSLYVPWIEWARHGVVTVAGVSFAWAAWKARLHELALREARR